MFSDQNDWIWYHNAQTNDLSHQTTVKVINSENDRVRKTAVFPNASEYKTAIQSADQTKESLTSIYLFYIPHGHLWVVKLSRKVLWLNRLLYIYWFQVSWGLQLLSAT